MSKGFSLQSSAALLDFVVPLGMESGECTPPESPVGGSCRICMDAPEGLALLEGACGCKNAKVHYECLKRWVRTSQQDAALPVCEVCQKPYNVPFPQEQQEQPRTRVRVLSVSFKFLQACVPLAVGFIYGMSYLAMATTQWRGFEVAFFGNIALVVSWGLFIVFPRPRERELIILYAKYDVLVLAIAYLLFVVGWVSRWLPRMETANNAVEIVSIPAHMFNSGVFLCCAVLRMVCATNCPSELERARG